MAIGRAAPLTARTQRATLRPSMMDDPRVVPVTEQENPRSRDIAAMPIADAVALINDEDAGVAAAVRQTLPEVARAIDGIVARLEQGGRLIHVGTGTSGRLGVLDASECPPTFGVSPDLVQGLIAGGYEACYRAVEASEDDCEAGGRDLDGRGVAALDAVVGIAASGGRRTRSARSSTPARSGRSPSPSPARPVPRSRARSTSRSCRWSVRRCSPGRAG